MKFKLKTKVKRRIFKKLDKIDEETIYIERPKTNKYNDYNQINIWDKIYDLYLNMIYDIKNIYLLFINNKDIKI